MKRLSLYNTSSVDELAWPEEFEELTLDSNARVVFTDFHDVQPLVIDSQISAAEAEQIMHKTHVRMEFVVNDKNRLMGVVCLNDLNGQEIIRKMTNGYRRDELTINDFLHPKEKIKAFDYAELMNATVADVIDALKESGLQHCLVIDRAEHKIRGLISASDIAKKLRLPIDIATQSNFLEIFKAVNG